MAESLGLTDLTNQKVSPTVPVAVVGAFALAQLALGTSPVIVLIAMIGILLPLLPLFLRGRDIYGLIGIIFSSRYLGVALALKTLYGQRLEENLFDPYGSFALYLILMAVITAILFLARSLDRGKALFTFPTDPQGLRRLSIIACALGLCGQIVVGATRQIEAGASTSGPIFVLAVNIADLFYLGLIAQTMSGIIKSQGRTFSSPWLIMNLLGVLLFSLALNWREFFATGLVSVVATAFLFNAVRLRHVLLGVAVAVFFNFFLTPITMQLRFQRQGLSRTQFVELAKDTVIKVITDPSSLREIQNNVKFHDLDPNRVEDFDYYGDRASVANRLSEIALLDAVYNGVKTHNHLGMKSIKEAFNRNLPGFLGFEKKSSVYGMGDWLSWQTGMGTPGVMSFLTYCLPMEGLAAWGLPGFIAFPIIFFLPVLLVWGWISSLRTSAIMSIFTFTTLQHGLIEATSDGFLGMIIRDAPIQTFFVFGLYLLCSRGAKRPDGTHGNRVPVALPS